MVSQNSVLHEQVNFRNIVVCLEYASSLSINVALKRISAPVLQNRMNRDDLSIELAVNLWSILNKYEPRHEISNNLKF